MKKTLTLLFILSISLNINAQKYSTSKDSIKVFYDMLFSNLKEGYINKDSVNWPAVEYKTISNLSVYTDFKNSLDEIEPLFSKINATHCAIYYMDNIYSIKKAVSPESYSEQ